jgi:hypothetical protein
MVRYEAGWLMLNATGAPLLLSRCTVRVCLPDAAANEKLSADGVLTTGAALLVDVPTVRIIVDDVPSDGAPPPRESVKLST